ncbi:MULTISPECIES: type II toxin-antitoxin system death-on-curing family toxin [unclassified Mesorhizobium]|uniref:type II toxin-antitoxin system death-on-curing family toxin n=1 Tax=unclassified Mesorhizobium TaxID=325217 RepID=UPI00241664CA|nr:MULTISPECIES: type II toxin-antitoxin system death-on-curing family toxin [unclassified Mesorhizobium]MDG4899678.1 type II toxin-antitoxin system death-on-curing family toxin [Mesorhizobium sp. WSM4962]MDG4918085.1 type II toxin-antitoxin system death-on-curing family toxin [Mesorhizobium sp. WSM4989]
MNEPNWLTSQDIIDINKLVVAETRENHALVLRDNLDGAVARPRQIHAYESHDMLDLAVALMVAVARAHVFEQGNKRTGFIAADVFLKANGYHFTEDWDYLASLLIDVVEHRAQEHDLIEALVLFIEPFP